MRGILVLTVLAGLLATVAPATGTGSDADHAQARLRQLQRRFRIDGGATRATGALQIHLPRLATDSTSVSHAGLQVRFSLRGTTAIAPALVDGIALYPGALHGSDLVHRVTSEGTEDYVVFESKPAREEVVYDVDVSRVAGLRLVANTLELLDAAGTPTLRVAPPVVVEEGGARHAARLLLDGCAYDVSPRGPWGRVVTPPGASACRMHVTWSSAGVAYPAVLDPSWTTTGAIVDARKYHTASVLLGGKVLFAGGGSVARGSAELYDPATATFAATGSMTQPRDSHTATVLMSGKVLCAGGSINPASPLGDASAEIYDPGTGTFSTAMGPMAGPRVLHTATLLASGMVLVAGGTGSQSGGNALATAELFDPISETFSVAGAMVAARRLHTSSLLASGDVLLAGGFHNMVRAEAELYDPVANTFTATAGSLKQGRYRHTASVLASGGVLMVGGYPPGNNPTVDVELYQPTSRTFVKVGGLMTGRVNHSATRLASGKVLVAGGFLDNFSVGLSSVELYDPGLGTFSSFPSLVAGHAIHTASLLASGDVLVAGGVNPNAELLKVVGPGAACAHDTDCLSGFCRGGSCCQGSCSGTCKTCSAGSGACVPLTDADDLLNCTGDTKTCGPTGACDLKSGQPCPGGSSTCASRFCVDGVCCNTACEGGCDSCNVSGKQGTCTVTPQGDTGASPACSPYACDGIHAACPASCAKDEDCARGSVCDPISLMCVIPGRSCVDHVTTATNGTVVDCTPYKCESSGVCKGRCASIDDCVAPTACNTSGQCVLPSSETAGAGGCALRPRPGSMRTALVACGAALALMGALRARRRAPR